MKTNDDTTLPSIFEANAKLYPTSVAVEFEGQNILYERLNLLSDQLAAYLISTFAVGSAEGPNVSIGILLPRGLDQYIAVLGILKAGFAYLPLDLAFPPDRVCYSLEDANAVAVLTYSSVWKNNLS